MFRLGRSTRRGGICEGCQTSRRPQWCRTVTAEVGVVLMTKSYKFRRSCMSLPWLLLAFGATSADGLSYRHPRPNFAVGQEWSIRSSQQLTAKIVIGRIEPLNDKIVVHVAIFDIQLQRPPTNSTRVTEIGHAPFEESALAGSVGDLIANGVTPPSGFETGYEQWRRQQGGIFTVSVSHVIAMAQKTLKEHN
jgi:hypothetical protein